MSLNVEVAIASHANMLGTATMAHTDDAKCSCWPSGRCGLRAERLGICTASQWRRLRPRRPPPAARRADQASSPAAAELLHRIPRRRRSVPTDTATSCMDGLTANGQPADRHYADLHPMGNYAMMAIGHVLPVPANHGLGSGCVETAGLIVISPQAQCGRIPKTAGRGEGARMPTSSRYWNAMSQQLQPLCCGDWRAPIGMRAPNDLQVSYAFVPSLRDLNEPRRKRRSADKRGARSTPQRRRAVLPQSA